MLADQQFVEDNTQTENIAAAIDSVTFAARLLGAHVRRRPGKLRPLADVLFPQSQTEVNEVGIAIRVDEDISRLHVPVHKPIAVGIVQRVGHDRHNFDGPIQAEGGFSELLCEVSPFDKPRDNEKGMLGCAADVINRDDVRMLEIGDGASFGKIGVDILGSGDPLRMRHLNGHGSTQLLVTRKVDETKASLAEKLLNSIASDSFRQDGGCTRDGRGRQPLNGAGDRFAFGHSPTFSAI